MFSSLYINYEICVYIGEIEMGSDWKHLLGLIGVWLDNVDRLSQMFTSTMLH